MKTVLHNSVTTTFTYNDADQIVNESQSGGIFNPISVGVGIGIDSFLRRQSLSGSISGTPFLAQSYGYASASRLETVTESINATAHSATYFYSPNSRLVNQIDFRQGASVRAVIHKQFDALDRLQLIDTRDAHDSRIGSHEYRYNTANQRVQTDLPDGSFWSYRYDNLGQVTTALRQWPDRSPVAGQQFDYSHDDIGNRTKVMAGGDEDGGNFRVSDYVADNLNRYTSRTVPGAVDVMGVALPTSTLTIDGGSLGIHRHGEYFRKELSVNNQTGAVRKEVPVTVDGTTVSRAAFLPKQTEYLSYDLDGNLTSDDRWDYGWNSENQLVRMVSKSTQDNPRYRVYFYYDWMGRRIRKLVLLFSGATVLDQRYIYDGWNLVAVLNAANQPVRTFVWGLDLSGSLQGAGGVGGLLAIREVTSGNGTHFATYDGNGDIAALISAVDGSVSARYEYGPFGEPLRASGTMALINPFRFSTKFTDDETDLVYYGFRYFNPTFGGWLNADPAGEAAGLHLRAFCGNDPITYIDTDGRQVLLGAPMVSTASRLAPAIETAGTSSSGGSIIISIGRGPVGWGLTPPVPPVLDPSLNPQPSPVLDPFPKPSPTATQQEQDRPEAYLYRAMKADAGRPMIGHTSASHLGVRRRVNGVGDVEVGFLDIVKPKNAKGEYQGMSVTPNSPRGIYYRLRPRELIGLSPGQDDGPGKGSLPVWQIRYTDFSGILGYHQDSPTHGVIYTKECIKFGDFNRLLAESRFYWRLTDLSRFK